MKKIFAMLLAVIMVFSLATVAFATTYEGPNSPDQTTGTYVDIEKVQLKKTYKTVGENAKNPAEDFEYTISLKSYSDSGYIKQSDIPLPYFDNAADQTGIISFTEGEATATGDTNTVDINLPEYEYVGIYTYEIKETKGNTMGVTYDDNSLFLKVTAVEQDGIVRVAALHYEKEDGAKTEGFENIYSADDLTVEKIVTGNLGDQTKDFSFNVKFNVPTDGSVYVKNTIEVWVNGAKVQSFVSLVDGYNLNLTLRHGQNFEIKNLPYGVTYTVTEADYTDEGYDAPLYQYLVKMGGATIWMNEGSSLNDVTYDAAKIAELCVVDGENEYVKVTNNKEAEVDTGIALDSMPYVLILAVAAVGLVLFTTKKRVQE